MQTNKKNLTGNQAKKQSASKSPEASNKINLNQLAYLSKSNSDIKDKRASKRDKKRKELEVRYLISCCLRIVLLTLKLQLEEANCSQE